MPNFADPRDEKVSTVQRAWNWLARKLIQDVPEEIALCEFECRKSQCTHSEWLSCERRPKNAAQERMATNSDFGPKRSVSKVPS